MNRELFEVRGNSLVIHVPEELNHHNAEPIRQGADQILEKQQLKQVIFDFQETVFMDSSGIGVNHGALPEHGLSGREGQCCPCGRAD